MSDFDLTGKSLEEAMICYAIRARSRAYRVDDWRFFKLEFPCENTAQELYDKFWKEIIPNKENYSIVGRKPAYGIMLSFITNPLEIVPIPTPNFQHIQMKPLFAALREEDKRKERAGFEDPLVLRINKIATNPMANPPNLSAVATPERSQIPVSPLNPTGATATSRLRTPIDLNLLFPRYRSRSPQTSRNDGSVSGQTSDGSNG